MLVVGIISLIVGAVLFYLGSTMNNDLDAQLESILNYGISNPGDNFESIGIILMIIGALLVIVGVIVKVSKNQKTSDDNMNSSTQKIDNQDTDEEVLKEYVANTWLCQCGARNSNYLTTCSYCNATKISDSSSWKCDKCGRINQDYVGTCGCGQRKP